MAKEKAMLNNGGFTLIEMLIAFFILAVGLTALISMQGTGLKANTVSNRISVSSMLAEQIMEDIVSRGVTTGAIDLRTSVSNVSYVDPVTSSATINVNGAGSFNATYSITPNQPISGTSEIQVTVNYISPSVISPPPLTYTMYKVVQ